ncbi:hypothetical protein DPMN_098972 [Dreissena polymorpha]|uniref:Uncharacterized protein n=1 Tax=Dreissena polymorpha TaxID=45954 RepID=A0A9D4LD74_DREPO|nr:hypothetical protein DPMN_098972 [Dreissena polymorpha]
MRTADKLGMTIPRKSQGAKLHNFACTYESMLTMKNAPLPGSHVFQPIVTIFELIQDIIETYIRAKFYEDWKYKHGIHRSHKTALPNGGHVFKRTRVIFKQC